MLLPTLLAAASGGICLLLCLYLLLLALASRWHRVPAGRGGQQSRLQVLIPAHNEQELISRSVESLLAQSYPGDRFQVTVIADNCSDATAEVARWAGAEVLVRDQPEAPGKGRALRWALDGLLAQAAPADAFVIVDADSIAGPDLLRELEAELAAGHEAVQADYEILVDAASPRSQLVAAGFLLFHRVRFSGRAALGMPASLVGNGMLFSRRLLQEQPWDAFTGVEDLEYSIRLRLAGIRPRFASRAQVWGPVPGSNAGATKQRLRWEGGRLHVMRTRMWQLCVTALLEGRPRLLDAALDLAVPPLGLLAMMIGAGLLLAASATALHLAASWVLVPWLLALAALPAFVLTGLAAAGAPAATYGALLQAPWFLIWKVLAYGRLLRGFDVHRWDRSERPAELSLKSSMEQASSSRVVIAGVPIDRVDMEGALSRMSAAIGGDRLLQVSTVNLDFLIRAQRDPEVRRIFRSNELNVPDGAPVVWLGRLLDRRMKARVAGADMVPLLVERAAASGARVFLLGGEQGAAAEAARRFQERHPDLRIAGCLEPPRAAVEEMDNDAILGAIKDSAADILLVAFGHPKQELWIDRHRDRLPVSVAIGVGCVFDLVAGRSRRAPMWMQNAGLEWAYRLAQEPHRLLGRYLTDLSWLLVITPQVLVQRWGTRFST